MCVPGDNFFVYGVLPRLHPESSLLYYIEDLHSCSKFSSLISHSNSLYKNDRLQSNS